MKILYTLILVILLSEASKANDDALKILTSYDIILTAKYVDADEVGGRYYIEKIYRGRVDQKINFAVGASARMETRQDKERALFLFNQRGNSFVVLKMLIRGEGRLKFMIEGKRYESNLNELEKKIALQNDDQ